jgi:hypothetical protein
MYLRANPTSDDLSLVVSEEGDDVMTDSKGKQDAPADLALSAHSHVAEILIAALYAVLERTLARMRARSRGFESHPLRQCSLNYASLIGFKLRARAAGLKAEPLPVHWLLGRLQEPLPERTQSCAESSCGYAECLSS